MKKYLIFIPPSNCPLTVHEIAERIPDLAVIDGSHIGLKYGIQSSALIERIESEILEVIDAARLKKESLVKTLELLKLEPIWTCARVINNGIPFGTHNLTYAAAKELGEKYCEDDKSYRIYLEVE